MFIVEESCSINSISRAYTENWEIEKATLKTFYPEKCQDLQVLSL